ncbi:hypothetical protein LQ938_07330 [Microbacterium sp. cx-55]|uniref:hypothetical protein n=1 Tax=Microbacterium sp. cx-55 TaxID=2875948 RepID=UPI001CBFE165|nr:hypothetical protein [Microbacterium sp. cx-55]MBZ4486442.1 hypothetical protein [Microbacterium sp. cx-55]UGB36585.1 hypothetical protein LQ938_07330 [Microbacterium sp. cx-55]
MTEVRVYCVEYELEDDGEVLTVGDRIRRVVVPYGTGEYFGTELDRTPWMFDRAGFAAPGLGGRVLEGVVTRIDAIYVQRPVGQHVVRGSAQLEPLPSTDDWRRPELRTLTPSIPPGFTGTYFWATYEDPRIGDEDFSGWVITVDTDLPLGATEAESSE